MAARPYAEPAAGIAAPTIDRLAALDLELKWPTIKRTALEAEQAIERLSAERAALRVARIATLEAEYKRDLRPLIKRLDGAVEELLTINAEVLRRVEAFQESGGRVVEPPFVTQLVPLPAETRGGSETRASALDGLRRNWREQGLL
jgi:hypothetical protein